LHIPGIFPKKQTTATFWVIKQLYVTRTGKPYCSSSAADFETGNTDNK